MMSSPDMPESPRPPAAADDSSTRGGPERGATPPRAADILRPAFRRSMWTSYDHLGLVVLSNLLWLALALPIVTAPAATAGLFYLATKLARGEPARARDVIEGFRLHFAPATKIGALTLLACVVIWVAIDFYAHLGSWATVPGMLVAGVLIWLAGFVLLIHVHIHPLVARGERSVRTILKKASLLTLDNLGYTIGIGAQGLAVFVLCVLTGAGLVLAAGGLLAVLLTCGHRELLKRYLPPDPDEIDPPETRGLRDLFRPWEGGKVR